MSAPGAAFAIGGDGAGSVRTVKTGLQMGTRCTQERGQEVVRQV